MIVQANWPTELNLGVLLNVTPAVAEVAFELPFKAAQKSRPSNKNGARFQKIDTLQIEPYALVMEPPKMANAAAPRVRITPRTSSRLVFNDSSLCRSDGAASHGTRQNQA